MDIGLDVLTFLDALRRTMLVVAAASGVLVGIDSIAILMSYPERPPHRPRANALSWLIASAAVTCAGGYILFNRIDWIGAEAPIDAKAALVVLYAGLAAAFTSRAVTRAPRPWLTVSAALLMSAAGTFFALLDPLP